MGPGGVPIAGDLTHRTPPTGAWGDTSANAPGTEPYAFPTSYQDNDPLRRPCPFGGPTAYPLSRKLYDNSIPGFAAATVTSDELALVNYENTHGAILATANGFIPLGSQSPGATDQPFCEDFNEFAVCSSGASNADGCAAMPASLPGNTRETICGNGKKEAYEECDCGDGVDGSPSTDPNCTAAGANGLQNGAAPNFCSLDCRKN